MSPEYVRLAPLYTGIDAPTSVALDSNGRLYVAEASRNRVVVLSQGGIPLTIIPRLAKPISVAVAADNGRIFVGNKARGNVEVYDAAFNLLFKLGQGNGEFAQPASIAIHSSGDVYVADTLKNIVNIYNPDGTYQSSLGSPGTGNGEFTGPVSLVIDPLAGELIVLDIPQTVTGRVQFFDLNGVFLRSFSNSIESGGQLNRPQQITVDNQSRVYVTDSFEQKVFVYGGSGNPLAAISDIDHPLRTPLGITINDTNRLYVASLRTHTVEVYGIDHFTDMHVEPTHVAFEVRDKAGSPPPRPITIENGGNQAFDYMATTDTDWINLSQAGATLQPSGSSTLNVHVNPTGLAPGTYSGSISISAGTMATERVNVVLKVMPAAYLSVTPEVLKYRGTVGIMPSAQTLSINNLGSKTLYWKASTSDDWIVTLKNSGTVPDSGLDPESLTVLVDTSTLSAGIYTGSIAVTGGDAVASPAVIEVILILDKAPDEPPPVASTGKIKGGDASWTVSENLPETSFHGVWGNSASNIFIVGEYGIILHYDGQNLNPMGSCNPETLHSIWVSSKDNIFSVGDSGAVLHYDGKSWEISLYAQQSLLDVWGNSAKNILAVGDGGGVLNDFLTSWTMVTPDSSKGLRGIWGSSDANTFAVGDGGTILHYDGNNWSTMNSGTDLSLWDIWGSSDKDIFAVGAGGTILHYDGNSWSTMNSGTEDALHAVWGSSNDHVLAVGANGTIVHYDGKKWSNLPAITSNTLWDIWGTGSGPDMNIIVVGDNGTILNGKGLKAFPWILFMPLLSHQQQKNTGN